MTTADMIERRLRLLESLAAANETVPNSLKAMTAALNVRFAIAAVQLGEVRSGPTAVAAVLDGEVIEEHDFSPLAVSCSCIDDFVFVTDGAEDLFASVPGLPVGIRSWSAMALRSGTEDAAGLVLVADDRPLQQSDAQFFRAVLSLVGRRIASEVERVRSEEMLRGVALAVSRSRGDAVLDELVQLMATLLGVEIAFIAQVDPARPGWCTVLAMCSDGELVLDASYPFKGTPCETVIAQKFRAYTAGVRDQFADDEAVREQCVESYAGYPVSDSDGNPLGFVAVASRQGMQRVDRVEALLKIFAVRAGAEIERLSARRELEASQASYRAIFEASEDAVFVHHWDTGAILDVNRKACDAYGYTREEFLRLTVGDLGSGVMPYTSEGAQQYFELARDSRCPTFEWHRKSKDGSLHWDEVRLKPATLAGQPRILAFTREITDRKYALEQLQLREEQYRMIFESSSDGLFVWDESMRIVDVNPAALELYGYSREQVISRGFPEHMPPEYVHERLEMLRRASKGASTHVETRELRADGTWFDADLKVMPFRHRGQAHALVVVRDVGERLKRERLLQRSEARLRATVEAAFDCIISMDQNGRVVEFNAAAERVFGYTRDEALGAPLASLILPRRYREAHRRGLESFHSGKSSNMIGKLVETVAIRKDGSEFPVELAISVADVPDGSIFVGHLRDISQRQLAEAQRQALEAQLRQAQKMEAVGQLTGGIAHDFNNILTSVMGYVVLGQDRAVQLGDPTLSRHLGQAHLAAQRARDLISQMLAFSRKQVSDPRPLALAPLTRQTLKLLRSTLPTSIDIDVVVSESASLSSWVMADPVQIEQVLFNLCLNARDAVGELGCIRVELQLVDQTEGHCASCREPIPRKCWVAMRVSDTGHGVAPEHLERIFDPFFSTKAPGQGSGMGLAMVHGIVHGHGGHLTVVTTPGAGSTFTVLLPAADPPNTPEPLKKIQSKRQDAPLVASIMLVEDDPSVGDYLSEQLRSWGLTPHLVRSPLEAKRRFESEYLHVDLVLTDLTMPHMTGLELASALRALRPDLPVILLTGNGGPLDKDQLQISGIRRVLRKPLEPSELRLSIHQILRTCHSSG